ncbi:hypothetical protein PAXRUDRAFT_159026, partial [Paxillus rubicundulus Ve08.2h10]
KKIIIISILIQSTNQKSNALQSIFGIFLQSTHTPQKVIETLACMGISVSVDAINAAVRSLSAESHRAIQSLGRTLLAAYAYDNFDVDLKSVDHTAEKSTESLKHLTSGLLFPLTHGVKTEDLRCSKELWEKSSLNLKVEPSALAPCKGWRDLLGLYPDSPDGLGMTWRDRFNSWKMLSDLINFRPPYFTQFKGRLHDPEVIEAIPVVLTDKIQ